MSPLVQILAALVGGALSRTASILTVTAVVLPMCLLRDLSALAPVATAGVMAVRPHNTLPICPCAHCALNKAALPTPQVAYSAVFIALRAADGSCAPGGALFEALPVAPQLAQASLGRVSVGTAVLFNMLSTAFMAHTNAVGARTKRELAARTPALAPHH